MDDPSPLTPEQAIALARFAATHGPGWKAELRAQWLTARAEPALHRLRNTHGPSWLARVTLEAAAALDFTAHASPVLAVPCPVCGQRAGAWCLRPSGHRASRLHSLRAAAADLAFLEQHGASASLRRTGGGWVIDPQGRARD